MGSFSKFDLEQEEILSDSLKIDIKKGKVKVALGAFTYIDNDTKQTVVYVPSLELSGYGETLQKAKDIIRFNMNEFFDYLMGLTVTDIDMELISLGWKKGHFNKQYSKAYVDIDGNLQNFNAENNKIERVTLTTA